MVNLPPLILFHPCPSHTTPRAESCLAVCGEMWTIAPGSLFRLEQKIPCEVAGCWGASQEQGGTQRPRENTEYQGDHKKEPAAWRALLGKIYPVVGSFREDLDRVADRICRGAACKDVRREGFPYPALEWTTLRTQSWTMEALRLHSSVQASKMPSCISAATGKVTHSPAWVFSAAPLPWISCVPQFLILWVGDRRSTS